MLFRSEGWNGDSFEFDASSSVGGFVEWEWDFGDGITASGEQTSHAWDTGKTYYVVLTAKDADGRQSRAYQSIVIDQRSEGDGDVDALDGATETIATNPYIDEVRVEISVTGDNLIFSSSVTVTFSPPEGEVRQQSITVGSGNTQVLDWIAQGKVGDWTVELESEDFEFSYIVAWELDYRLSAE